MSKQEKFLLRDRELFGKRFGKIVIQEYSHSKDSHRIYNFICDCGYKGLAYSHMIGKTKSCVKCNKFRGLEDLSLGYFNRIKANAIKKNKTFNITIKDAWGQFIKQKGICALSGREMKLTTNGHNQTASLDRIDSSKGYIKSNIQWVHKDFNYMKNDLNEYEFIKMCKEVIDYRCYDDG